MSGVGFATISILPEAKGFGSKLSSQIDPELASAGKRSGTSFSKVLGVGILGGLGAVMAGFGAVLHTGFGEAMDASAGTAQLAAGIKSTGNAAGVSVKGLNDLASSIQGMSGQTDDSIVASEKLLLTFTNIKNKGPDKIFDQATLASANMAAKMGGDASASAIQLGKALNDPVKGISALSRVGVSFTDGQKKSIEAMVKHGDTAGAQKIILAELSKEFGGAAKAAGESLPGQLAKAKRSFEDVSQAVVEGLIPIVAPALADIGTKITTNVLPAVSKFVTGFKDGTGAGGQFRDVLDKTGAALVAVGTFLKDHTGLVKAGAIAVGVLTIAVQAHNLAIFLAEGGLKKWILQTTIVKTATAVWAAGQWLLNAALTANPIGIVVVAVGLLIAGIVLIATKTTWFQTIWKTMTGALGTAWQFMWNSILAPIIRFVLNGFASIVDGIASMLRVLSNIPGFGWAKTAADKMAGAADKARALANGIRDIPDRKDVTITVTTLQYGRQTIPGTNIRTNIPMNAAGTDNWRGGPTWVGERGPEIVNLPKGSQVIPNHKLGGRSDGATSADIAALGDRIGSELERQARTIQTMQRQMAGAR